MPMKNKKVLSWLIAVFCLIQQMILAQNISVQGTVTDENGETMIGVSVLVKGTTTGAITDLDGNFSLSVSSGSTLVFSYIGYKTQEEKVTGSILKEGDGHWFYFKRQLQGIAEIARGVVG